MTLPENGFDPDKFTGREWALMYRNLGLQVVPAQHNGKKPALASWVEFQHTLAPQSVFDQWFPEDCGPDMGLIAGAASGGLLVVDLDDYKGFGSAEWFSSIVPEPETWQQRTGGGGRHIFYRLPPGKTFPNGSHPGLGVDIRCQGGFAKLPPSGHESGNRYEWVPGFAPWETDLEDAPQAIIDALEDDLASRAVSDGVTSRREKTTAEREFNEFGARVDGREQYMADTVFAAVLDHYNESPIFDPVSSAAACDEAFTVYANKVRSRLPPDGTSNEARLEREGRGHTAFRRKWDYLVSRQWGGKVRAEAEKKSAAPAPDIFPTEVEPDKPDRPVQIVRAGDFVAGFVPPDYLIDGIVQKSYLYSLTAPTGHGKTAVTMCLAQAIALGRNIRDRDVERGRVLILAGENPDDVRARLLVMSDAYEFDPAAVDIYFIPGVFDVKGQIAAVREQVAQIGEISLVVVDTAAAYFPGDEPNNNAQQGAYARMLREYTTLPGKPAVIVCSHPKKGASRDDLSPMGGSAFVNEVDGNLTLWSGGDGRTQMHWSTKFRGPEFEPIDFRLETRTADNVVDAKGRPMPSVVAVAMGDIDVEMAEAEQDSHERVLLAVIGDNPKASVAELARKANWINDRGQPLKARVFRVAEFLVREKMVVKRRRKLIITEAGKRELGWDE